MKRLLGIVCAAFAFATSAFADPITFIHTGRGSGTLAGVAFSDSAFTITATGDTATRTSLGFGFFVDHASAAIDIAGVGILTFITGTRTFVNNSSEIVGFSRAGISGADLYNGPQDAVFGLWDMLTGIGPIAGAASLLQWTNSNVDTSGGVLVFNTAGGSGTFQAIVGQRVPEPATLALLALGVVLVGVSRRGRVSG